MPRLHVIIMCCVLLSACSTVDAIPTPTPQLVVEYVDKPTFVDLVANSTFGSSDNGFIINVSSDIPSDVKIRTDIETMKNIVQDGERKIIILNFSSADKQPSIVVTTDTVSATVPLASSRSLSSMLGKTVLAAKGVSGVEFDSRLTLFTTWAQKSPPFLLLNTADNPLDLPDNELEKSVFPTTVSLQKND